MSTTPKPHPTPTQRSSQHTRLKDFSVESQRRTFIAEQERERAIAENRRSSRRIARAAADANTHIQLSGLIRRVNNDDDDSEDDLCSVGSEESFYVGIERADYSSPDTLEMYGEESKEVDEREDRLGIGRVGSTVVHVENGGVMHNVEGSDLYSFMTGKRDTTATNGKKHVLVGMPLVVNGINYKQGGGIGDEDHSQVYQQEAAEGKMFINKLVEGGASDDSTVADMVHVPDATPAKRYGNTPLTTPGTARTASRGGHYPVISPMALFSPHVGNVSRGEDNAMRQMREREIRKDAETEAKKLYDEKLNNLQRVLESLSEDGFPVSELKKRIEDVLRQDGDVV